MRFWSRRRTRNAPEQFGTGDVGFPSVEPADAAAINEPADPATIDAPHEMAIETFLDLHPFRPRDILDVVDAYLEEAQRLGLLEVRLIHGKGIGFQRERVQKFLAGHLRVQAFRDAPADRGHWGATLVQLHPADTKSRSDL